MKKILAIFLSALLILCLAACGGKTDPVAPDGGAADTGGADASQQTGGAELSAWLKTKTGKYYSQFLDGKMYMEYEIEYAGTVTTVISATSGARTYSESMVNGQSVGVSIMDGEYLYSIDHASKIVVKMSLKATGQEIARTMIEEGDVDPANMQSGTRTIDGKTYDTEAWDMDGAKSVLCFDGDKLAYMIGEYGGEETVMKILKTSDQVDESLFDIPADYQMISY
ncbi:MAG: hypothetical protein VB092_04110 [Oscillospiraceae bacterium]|nr:hypothetical protein [Oscillospiraceae bacterium]